MIIVVSCLLNIVGAFITIVIFNEYALCIGNFIQGLSTGTFTMIIPNFSNLLFIYSYIVKELSPCHIAGFAIGFNEFYSIAGIFVALIFCSLYMIYVEVIWWRIIWGFPIAVALLQLFLLLFIFPLDTPRYYYFDGDKKMVYLWLINCLSRQLRHSGKCLSTMKILLIELKNLGICTKK